MSKFDSEEHLVREARAKNEAAWLEIIETYRADLCNCQYWRNRIIRESTDDLVSETFRRAYQSLQTYRGDGLYAWLCGIARYVARDVIRSQNRDARRADRLIKITELLGPADSDTPLDRSLEAEEKYKLKECLSIFRDRDQQAISMISRGRSYADISQVLGISRNAVGPRLTWLRDKIRECLKGKGLINEN